MSARIIELAAVRAKRRSVRSRAVNATGQPVVNCENFYFWRGSSTMRYVHTIYSLLECPEVPNTNYLLVKLHDNGHRTVLAVGLALHDAPSLNLAEIRQRGAQLGATEVHIHMLAKSIKQAKLVEFDLRAALIGLDAATLTHH